ncbi:sialidase family protein [Streptomyces sp. P17]|uniref:WD40/YVTN/BNR-like repeat-containing protein n=1 Tax=Streptomyces sp. P17 TaxID=3074716 RepID=UPI0028F4399E|nr:sialidase family protein [Streptomyces sp. P17]MDT9697298.1 sialidase family protein [Streptomyces sp. P17]
MRFHGPRALLLGAVLLLLPTACGAGATGERAGNSAAPSPTTAAGVQPPRIPSAVGLPGWSHSPGFAADGSGFALLAQCTETRCEQHVAVLDKDARRWRLATSPLPDVTGDLGITAGLTVLGPGRAVIIDQSEDWRRPAPTWFTRDNGRTWKRGSTAPTGRTATVPEGALMTDECLELESDLSSCARNRLLVVLPDTGEHRVLERQPPLKGILAPSGDVAEDALFVSGEDDSGRPALARSEDRGRTWEVTRMTEPGKDSGGFRVVAGPDRLYAAQPGQLMDEEVKNGLHAIHTSTDGGRTWTRVWAYRKGVEPLSILGDLVVAADGTVTVYGESGVWHSTDGARTFRSDGGGRAPSGSTTRTPLGWLWNDSSGSGRYRISADGVRWHEFALGGPASGGQ